MQADVTPSREMSDAQLDRIFQALSDGTRRAILRRLSAGPGTVKELAAPFVITLPAIGKHLRVLEAAGLLDRRISGRNHVCSLAPEALSGATMWLENYRTFWEQNLAALAAEFEGKDGS